METDTSETSTSPNNPAFLHFNTLNLHKRTYPSQIQPLHIRTPNAPSLLVSPTLFRSSIEQQQSSDGV
ncbi:hypothetical protein PEX1_034750 [Penicillium expansum]|uniref:Uncharacterized protein n=1 Tax=Penicillium expansum TaxID=27334 RepID=A0A0A2KP68_PENEN|nr:hypothetical protein PEX2_102950 [Penicillium expansum]KGO37987.1 hypothetical protein PEXP_080030 [Penicillium expansum]KGO49991.1 hypothetical protein PEX2_102950 [Penicillium expansum]KGO68753.1 hypothetical protein PEX1_034750 [Penicillium expansum]